ncbi:MAG: hypothetical protein A2487_09225 [Candidatus Raymondbacteria bacterium RifOxyC12_full_50_8]|uniref:Alpha-galactosidase n=1 Tax=Candidatus Raymondbacteria bacterium RIFOXYD12_FULL_49_13 TaxID=1817890 RepID=A0A1F7FFA7_UNCRA|nr:MAG: hypothetical protein A2248_22715 [Candidatus Raymondbacteria bacterium RIFOXYA2_FULL_49_16]OGJ94600.1 MAG: hypothetical protein A2350_05955 [Candidatus Raymondbacteria bacterium RifOxyB12_full_50_8]OGJ98870.1 MAG: hypothetical protein A2487_09225 [Candidatus Raymondbacteria bacterium RifOxyC12_full_50_8]OGK05379.1 MAG: hypothetical protein A2519_03665 [Candidatus Raymondbacteria bacterium RIFOXYD12_FULL_49_13]OGP42992.1 MAG: hypothetical protein A2324_16370 [Candidatus Raymondbacteria b
MVPSPLYVYINWSAYDELSDSKELNESLAMVQFDHFLRLRKAGARLDCYLMDAFWYTPNSGYRTWRNRSWPKGPYRWLKACKDNHVLPGLWFSVNCLDFSKVGVSPAWKGSLNRDASCASLFAGPFLKDFLAALQHWYTQGVRVFKLDFADFDAATEQAQKTMLPEKIREKNSAALYAGLTAFRKKNQDAIFLAYNGFGGIINNTSIPFTKTIDKKWLTVFASLYCGDPRPADVACANFWRSKDIYSDHMVRHFAMNGIPLKRIDNAGFMVGNTGTCYNRKTAAWKAMLLLSLARGGLVNTYYGDLGLLGNTAARFFAKAQALFAPFLEQGSTRTWGGTPGLAEPYGYYSTLGKDALVTVVNPSQLFQKMPVPKNGPCSLLFHDSGFVPQLKNNTVLLGPEQMCLLGFGAYGNEKHALGVEEGVKVPLEIKDLRARFTPTGHNTITVVVKPPANKDLRIIMTQCKDGKAFRSTGGALPNGRPMGEILKIRAMQEKKTMPVIIQYNKAIWSGLSHAVGTIAGKKLKAGIPLSITCSSAEVAQLELKGAVYGTTPIT